jgi:hypothetical protein
MDQFNKVLAAFLLLVVAVGISLFIFSRLGILSRIFPSTKLVSSTTTTQVSQSPSPTQTPTPTPQANKPGILGWLSQLGKPKITLTPSPQTTTKPDKAQTPTLMITNPTMVLVQTQDTITVSPIIKHQETIVPASGIEAMFIPAVSLSALFGLFLKHKAK